MWPSIKCINMEGIQLKVTIWQGPQVGLPASATEFSITFRSLYLENYNSYRNFVVKLWKCSPSLLYAGKMKQLLQVVTEIFHFKHEEKDDVTDAIHKIRIHPHAVKVSFLNGKNTHRDFFYHSYITYCRWFWANIKMMALCPPCHIGN